MAFEDIPQDTAQEELVQEIAQAEVPHEELPEPAELPIKKGRGRPKGSKNNIKVEFIEEELPEPEEPDPPRRRARASVAPPAAAPAAPEDIAALMLESLRQQQLTRTQAKRDKYASWLT